VNLENLSTTVKITDLPPTFGNPSKQIHGDVTPNLTLDWKRREEAGWMQVLNLVLLTHQVALHELSYMLAGMWAVERSPKSVESLLTAFVTHCVGLLQGLSSRQKNMALE
jgi:hypothetical protein